MPKIKINVVYVVYFNYNELENSISSLKNLATKLDVIFDIYIVDNSYSLSDIKIVNSYHCSQLNIYTKRLTMSMLDVVIKKSLVNIHVD